MIEVEDLWKSFGTLTVLTGISLKVATGEVICIIGPSGSGKSTLLRCINFLEQPDRGIIRINGEVAYYDQVDNRQILHPKRKIARVRSKLGMVFQEFNLFPHLTTLENVTLAPIQVKKINPREASLMGKRILERVGLGHKVDVYPANLSGGQQPRVAIARSLAMQPEVMLYDEPTSQLDPQLVDEVFSVMRELDNEGMTQIVVTHHEQFARETACKVLRFAGDTFEWSS